MKPYEWMVEITPQREWIEQRGLFVWLALYTGGLGSGFYLVSLYFNNLAGMAISWLIVVLLKCGFHLAYLGRPLRFWRLILNPQASWISRGFIILLLFTFLAGIQIVISYWMPGSPWELVLKILAGTMAFADGIYTGFVMNFVQAIPLWNSALLPVLSLLYGILSGCALIMAIALGGGDIDFLAAESMSRLLLVTVAALIIIYLWSATYSGLTGRLSVLELLRGRSSPFFWIGFVLIGMVFPIGIGILAYFVDISPQLMISAITAEIVGGMSFRYCLLKGGLYRPLIPRS